MDTNYPASFHLWRFLAPSPCWLSSEVLAWLSSVTVFPETGGECGPYKYMRAVKKTRVRREKASEENPNGGGMMEIPHIKFDGDLNSMGSGDRQLLGSHLWKIQQTGSALPETEGCGNKEST